MLICLDYLYMIAIKYICFAVVAISLNLFAQYLLFLIYEGEGALYLAILIGTGVGLVAKYILDKKYIFYHQPSNGRKDAQMFLLYSLTGVFTTVLFWGTELLFDYIYASENAKYLGAIIGLSVGYICKYFMDKKYVFTEVAL